MCTAADLYITIVVVVGIVEKVQNMMRRGYNMIPRGRQLYIAIQCAVYCVFTDHDIINSAKLCNISVHDNHIGVRTMPHDMHAKRTPMSLFILAYYEWRFFSHKIMHTTVVAILLVLHPGLFQLVWSVLCVCVCVCVSVCVCVCGGGGGGGGGGELSPIELNSAEWGGGRCMVCCIRA